MACEDPLCALLRSVRIRIQAGEGEVVVAEANAGGNEAKWLLIMGEAKLRMGIPREGLEAAGKATLKLKEEGNLRGQSLALQVLADCHLALHECAEVISLSVEAISISWQLEDKAAEALMMHTCAGAFQVQWRYKEATRAATRAAALFKEVGDKTGEAIALETAAIASVSQPPKEGAALLREIRGPPGGQAAMDAARFEQTSVLYEQKPWQPISKFHPILQQRENPAAVKKEHLPAKEMRGEDGRPLFQPRQYSWGRPSHRLDQAWYHMALVAGDKII